MATETRRQGDLRYSDRVFYSPRVPVFRADDGTLLEEPYTTSFLTAAAPNLGAIVTGQPQAAGSVPGVLAARAARILAVAAAHGHRRLVLGAWGCGVFRNDPAAVAGAFARQLVRAEGHFDHVVFAVLDRQRGTRPTPPSPAPCACHERGLHGHQRGGVAWQHVAFALVPLRRGNRFPGGLSSGRCQ
jgi:uncharacterized protein (TIGR02452 family)